MKEQSIFVKITDIVNTIGSIIYGTKCKTCGNHIVGKKNNDVPICDECLDLLKDMLQQYKRFREL